MDLHTEITYPAEPDQVAELLADPEYVAARCAATGAQSSEVDVEHDDGGFTVTTARSFGTDGFPSFLQKFVGAALRVVQEDRWEQSGDGAWVGHTSVSTHGAPARFEARSHLESTGSGTRQVVRGTITASIPFVGGTVEKLVHDKALQALQVEEQLAGEWLTR